MNELDAEATRMQRALALFQEALDVDETERMRWVEDSAAGDARLTELVLELLRADEASDVASSLERLVDDVRGIGAASAIDLELPDPVDTDRRYELEDEVASGGMGVVLRVFDKSLRRHVAMKVVRERGTSSVGLEPATLARFLHEAQITGQLAHPGVVPVHELGLDSAGRPYFTMTLVKGRDLKELIDEAHAGSTEWTRTRLLGVLLTVCETMAFAHDRGVVHRDLKSSNVRVGRYGEVYVMDWGLARTEDGREVRELRIDDAPAVSRSGGRAHHGDERGAAEDSVHDSPLVTLDGTVLGTPFFMPPEQAAGRLHEIGPASDVYAVGAMLYQLLSGRAPYHRPGTRPTPHAVLAQVLAGPPEPLARVCRDVPAELEAICEKAMAREIDRRYASMALLADDLRAFLDGRVVSAYRTGALVELRKWVARNRGLAGSLAALFLALAVGLVVSLWLRDRALANEALANERADDVLRLAAQQDLDELLAEADLLWPAHPELERDLLDWVDRARPLVDELPTHQARRDELRRLALPPTAVQQRGATSEARVDERRTWEFAPEHKQADWWNRQLSRLIDGLETLADAETGLLSADGHSRTHGWSVPRRIAEARALRSAFEAGGATDVAWADALPRIRAAYPGLELSVQMGLHPLGPDPDSGLWEFWHMSSGEAPVRGADGRLRPTEESGIVLVLLPGGTFWMGSQKDDPSGRNYDPDALASSAPVHEVTLSPFFLSKYELTQAVWRRLTAANPSQYGPDSAWKDEWLAGASGPSALHPVDRLSWDDCLTWLPRVGLTLPSEAQWEYAVRAGTDWIWFTGPEPESLAGYVNLVDSYALANGANSWIGHHLWLDDGATAHAPVGSYRPNSFGLHDMAGNVWEWCLDGAVEGFYARSPAVDPLAPYDQVEERIIRGGCYFDHAIQARSANRSKTAASSAGRSVGVRPARPIEPASR